MYLLAPFILQNFKNTLTANPEFWACAIFGPKMTHLLWTKFFGYKTLLLIWSTYWHFSFCKNEKNSYGRSRVADSPFLGPKWSTCPKQILFWKIIKIILIYLLAPLSLCKLLKKSFQRIQSDEDAQFLGPKWPISLNGNFSQRTC